MKKKVMVVDDEDSVLELEKAILEDKYDVITASNGEECLDKLKTEKPDLILLDMMMPGMSGREVCERIRKNPKTKDLKVAFVTVARFSEMGRETLATLKVADYVTKPFDNDDLLKRVKKLVG